MPSEELKRSSERRAEMAALLEEEQGHAATPTS